MHISELRDMGDEQLEVTLRETSQTLFRLRIQSQTERLDVPSELRRNRKLIAQIKTIQTERAMAAKAAEAQAAAAAGAQAAEAGSAE